jgi:hypothetical protein
MKAFVLYAVILFGAPPAWADDAAVAPGAQAENMQVLPPWVMAECGPTKELKATYDFNGAKALKEKDNQCNLWRNQLHELTAQVESYKRTTMAYQAIIDSFEQTRLADRNHAADLTAQLNQEISEKNKYKYQTNYGWVYGAVGAVIGVVGIAYGLGAAR